MDLHGIEHPELIGRFRIKGYHNGTRSRKQNILQSMSYLYNSRLEQIYDAASKFGLLVRNDDGDVISVLDIPQEATAEVAL